MTHEFSIGSLTLYCFGNFKTKVKLFNDLLSHIYCPRNTPKKEPGAHNPDSGTDGSKAFIHHSLCSVSYRKSLRAACVRVSTSVDLDDTIHQVYEPTSYRSEQRCFSISIYRWNVGVCLWCVHKSWEWAVLLAYSRGVMRFIWVERSRKRFTPKLCFYCKIWCGLATLKCLVVLFIHVILLPTEST